MCIYWVARQVEVRLKQQGQQLQKGLHVKMLQTTETLMWSEKFLYIYEKLVMFPRQESEKVMWNN